MPFYVFADRRDAGRRLAEALERFRGPDTVVLGIPRGGIVVAAKVAQALEAPLDVVIARKLGAPHQPELAIGALISAGIRGADRDIRLLDQETIRYLEVPDAYLEQETARQRAEIDRRVGSYRGDAAPLDLRHRTVIVIDDGIATGYTLRVALLALRSAEPARLVAAVPVAPPGVPEELQSLADEVVCLQTPEPFHAVGAWYEEFDQTSDEEVTELLRRCRLASTLA